MDEFKELNTRSQKTDFESDSFRNQLLLVAGGTLTVFLALRNDSNNVDEFVVKGFLYIGVSILFGILNALLSILFQRISNIYDTWKSIPVANSYIRYAKSKIEGIQQELGKYPDNDQRVRELNLQLQNQKEKITQLGQAIIELESKEYLISKLSIFSFKNTIGTLMVTWFLQAGSFFLGTLYLIFSLL